MFLCQEDLKVGFEDKDNLIAEFKYATAMKTLWSFGSHFAIEWLRLLKIVIV